MASPTLISRTPYKIWRTSSWQELGLLMQSIGCSASNDLGGIAIGGCPITTTASGAIYYSTDGKTFLPSSSAATVFASGGAVALMSQNGTYFLARNGTVWARAPITDPSSWTLVTPTVYSGTPIALMSIGNMFVSINASGVIYTSTDGQTWTAGATQASLGTSHPQSTNKVIAYYSTPLGMYVIASDGRTGSGSKIWGSTTATFSVLVDLSSTSQYSNILYAKSIETLIGTSSATAKSSTPFPFYAQLNGSPQTYYSPDTITQIIPPQIASNGANAAGVAAIPGFGWTYFDELTDYIAMYVHDEQKGPAIYSWNMKNAGSPTYTQPVGVFTTATVNAVPLPNAGGFYGFAVTGNANYHLAQSVDFKGKTIKISKNHSSLPLTTILIGEYA